MKRLFLAMLASAAILPAIGQISSTGLVADWRFTANTLDSSGNAHHGTPTAISYAAGRDGQPGTAAVFNSSSSFISVPYASDLNVINYSICAVIKPTAFYDGPCQGNIILERFTQTFSGYYCLGYADNDFDLGDCNAMDTSKFTFYANASNSPITYVSGQYTPTIRTNEWTSVVATYNGSQIRIYVNGVLKSIRTPVSASIGASFDGLGIGRSSFGTASSIQQNPYSFTGLIDDLRLYNRVLTDSEITVYHTPPAPTGVATNVERVRGGFTLSPNPAASALHIRAASAGHNTGFTILNELGSAVKGGTFSGTNTTVDISALPSGLYFVQLASIGEVSVQTFIKQ